MKYIVRYENFNESKGISDSCEKITNLIWNDVEIDIMDSNNISKEFTFSEDDFKLSNIQIEFNFNLGEKNICNAITNLKDSVIEDNYLKSTKIFFNIEYNKIDESFLYYIKSVIFHEILHVFQYYNLNINNKFRPESFSIGSIIPQIRKHIKTKYISYILDILYYSLSHELSAQLHQYYIYKIDGREYKRLNDIKNLLSNFKIKNNLDNDEMVELDYLKYHILNSIKYFTNNKNYKKDIEDSIWNKNNVEFLNGLSNLIKYKLKWIDKKIKLINSKQKVDYNETLTYYGDLENYKYLIFSIFIKENLNNCPIIDNI
jgi:hypothetical protein